MEEATVWERSFLSVFITAMLATRAEAYRAGAAKHFGEMLGLGRSRQEVCCRADRTDMGLGPRCRTTYAATMSLSRKAILQRTQMLRRLHPADRKSDKGLMGTSGSSQQPTSAAPFACAEKSL